jgi:hypothetical protein
MDCDIGYFENFDLRLSRSEWTQWELEFFLGSVDLSSMLEIVAKKHVKVELLWMNSEKIELF